MLLPRLLASLAPGGVLAVQMPDNRDEPSHALMRETAAAGPWAAAIGDSAALRIKVHNLLGYYDMLAPAAAEIDIWRTVYHHPMESAAAIVAWVSGTGLKPFLEPLTEPQRRDFLARSTKPRSPPPTRRIRTASGCWRFRGCSSWRGAGDDAANCLALGYLSVSVRASMTTVLPASTAAIACA